MNFKGIARQITQVSQKVLWPQKDMVKQRPVFDFCNIWPSIQILNLFDFEDTFERYSNDE